MGMGRVEWGRDMRWEGMLVIMAGRDDLLLLVYLFICHFRGMGSYALPPFPLNTTWIRHRGF
jgi:hypothetical protein